MANIPLVDIPNAPQVGPDPVLIPREGVNINMSGAARAMQRDTISADAFTAPGGALAKMGDALQNLTMKADNAFTQLADRKAMSKNYADLARADDVMQNARAAHSDESASLPENQWVPLWEEKYRPQVEQQLADLNLSPWSQEHVTPQLIKFDAATRTNLAYDAHKAELNRDAEAMANQFNRQTAAGQYEQAHSTLSNMERIGHITSEQSADMWAQTEKSQRINGASTVMAQDPAGMLADMQQAQKDGKSNWFPWMSSNEINQYAEMAQNHVQDLRVTKSNDIYGGISAGTIIDDKTLHATAGNVFDEDQMQKFNTALSAWPKYDPQTASGLRTAVANYDPSTDQDASQYQDLLSQIATTVPRDKQAALQQELAQQYTASQNGQPPDLTRRLRGDLYATVDGMASQGLLAGPDSNITTVYQKAGQLQDDIGTYLESNPDVSITDAKEWLAQRITGPASATAAAFFMKASEDVFAKSAGFTSGTGAMDGLGWLHQPDLIPEELRTTTNETSGESNPLPKDPIAGKLVSPSEVYKAEWNRNDPNLLMFRGVPPGSRMHTASDGTTFAVPGGVDFEKIAAAAKAGAPSTDIGQGGKFDFQRNMGGGWHKGINVYYPEYIDASNYAVGVFSYARGDSIDKMRGKSWLYAVAHSSNANSDRQVKMQILGWKAAESGHPNGK